MDKIISSSQRAIIMDLLKTKFSSFVFWNRIEADLAIKCSEIPEVVEDNKKRDKLIEILKDIKSFFIEQGVIPDELAFIDEEIDRYKYTKQISLYEEKEDYMDPEIIEKYARLGYGTEGVIGIHLPYNYRQLSKLTNGVYSRTGLIKFYISREKTLYGKIVAEIYEYPQKVTVAALIESKRKAKETEEPLKKWIVLFGQKYSQTEYMWLKK